VGEGAHAIGRSAACAIVVDDDQVAERHALVLVTFAGTSIEDLGAPSGVWVNGTRVRGRRRLEIGDAIVVGQSQIVLRTGVTPPSSAPNDAPTLSGDDLSRRVDALRDRGLAETLPGDAASRVEIVFQLACGGHMDRASVISVARRVLKIAEATRSREWVGRFVTLHVSTRMAIDDSMLASFLDLLASVHGVDVALVDRYVAAPLAPAARERHLDEIRAVVAARAGR
jgi:pSer/pThr/pTyr-binding forkhead associated (FHA) protein